MSGTKANPPDDPKGTSPVLDAWLADPGAAPTTGDLDAMFDELHTAIEKDAARPGRRLREAPTSVRRTLAIGTVVVLAALVAATMLRNDLSIYPPLRLGLELGAFGALIVTSLALALRPAYVPSLRRGVVASLVVASLGAAFGIALLPPAHAIPHEVLALLGDDGLFRGWPCLRVGLLLGLPVYFVARLLDRGTPLASVLAASAAGLTGNFLLTLHCPATGVEHRLVHHASVAAVFVLALGLAYLLDRRIPRRRA